MNCLRWLLLFLCLWPAAASEPAVEAATPKVFIVPIREDIMPPLTYLVRRGVKAAMEAKADVLILDMETNGGRVDTTEEIIEILGQFKGLTVTYVNKKAFSAGAFIAVATQKIYMAPQSVIGAAKPIMMMPGSGAPEDLPKGYDAKMTSAIKAQVAAQAEKNGHNPEVVAAMIDETKELKIGDKVLNEKGNILTLTDTEAAKEYGDPPKPLLSLGTVQTMEALLDKLGHAKAARTVIEPTGAERIAFWINAISPLLLIIGGVGIYIEFKTPGFGLPGIVGIIAFALYFFGGYIAGLSGIEWVAVFVLGLVLVTLELFVFPGTMFLGFTGAALMLVAILMALVDLYPATPSAPAFPGVPSLPRVAPGSVQDALQTLAIAMVGGAVVIYGLSRLLPRTAIYGQLVSHSASGVASEQQLEQRHTARIGQIGVAISPLRPGGKAQFGEDILDVMTQGDLIEKGSRVKIIGHSATEAIVEAA
jgi:membrane-bound serine protease (ClpP class)